MIFWDISALVALLVEQVENAGVSDLRFACADQKLAAAAASEGLKCL